MPNRRKLCHDRLWIYILGGKAVPSPSCCIYVRSVSLGCLRHPSFDRWLRRARRKLEYRYTFFRSKWEEFIFVVNEGKYYPVWHPVFLGQATHEDRFLPHTTHLNANILDHDHINTNEMQLFSLYLVLELYMFRTPFASIIRSTINCNSSHWCLSLVGME